jgi:hypothetical protein
VPEKADQSLRLAMADVAGTKIGKVKFAIILDLVGKRVADQLKQAGEAGALADRNVQDFALIVIGCEHGTNIGLNRIGVEAEVAAGLTSPLSVTCWSRTIAAVHRRITA